MATAALTRKEVDALFRDALSPRDKMLYALMDNLGWIVFALIVIFMVAFSALFHVSIYPIAAIVASIAFLFWCRAAHVSADERPGSRSFIVVMRRLVWMHVKLICWMTVVFGSVVLVLGAESKKTDTNLGLNHPIQAVLQILANFFAPVVLATACLTVYVFDVHRTAFNAIAVILYSIWLSVVTFRVVSQEYRK